MSVSFEEILVDQSIAGHPLCQKAIRAQESAQENPPHINVIPSEQIKELGFEANGQKGVLVLTANRGRPLRPCPGTFGEVCCNLYVFNFISGCPFSCSYCYLESYLNQGGIHIQVDLDSTVEHLCHTFRAEPNRIFRVGTGELADSLAVPASDPLNRYLINSLSREKNTLLELKTKSNRVDHLLDLDPRNRVVISWSLSPSSLAKREENHTASTSERIIAAKKVIDFGYQVALHLDPLMYCHPSLENWKKDYAGLLDEIFSTLPPHKISWISLGGLRLMKGLREKMEFQAPESLLPYQEMVPGIDGKLRYPKPLRKFMFQHLRNEIQKRYGNKAPPVYLCMETKEVWEKTLGSGPRSQSQISHLFSHSLPAN